MVQNHVGGASSFQKPHWLSGIYAGNAMCRLKPKLDNLDYTILPISPSCRKSLCDKLPSLHVDNCPCFNGSLFYKSNDMIPFDAHQRYYERQHSTTFAAL